MRVAVAGATGNIGSLTVAALERTGQEVVPVSRSIGVDLATGEGVDAALTGVDAVIDVTSGPAADPEQAVAHFGAMTRNLLAAGERAGVGHHVLLSVVAAARVDGVAHYAAKREQERLVRGGPVPWTIVPATQFHGFPAMAADRSERDGVATLAPLLLQPVAASDVADVLVEVALGAPQGVYPDVAGPDLHDMVDMARRTHQARGRTVKLVPTWSGAFGLAASGNAMLPGDRVRIMPITFDDWLATQHP